jgi:large subunit ribosomal protein L25
MITLKAQKREVKQKVVKIQNVTPNIKAVVYGPKNKSIAISVPHVDFIKTYNSVGTSGLINLEIDGEKFGAIIYSFTLDPVKNSPSHIDFYIPEKGKKVTAEVALEFTGESEAVKAGGLLVKVLHEVEVEALPEDLPHTIIVDISKLITDADDIKISDLKVSKGVSIVNDREGIVASIVIPKEEVENKEIDLNSIQVEKKGKKEEVSE